MSYHDSTLTKFPSITFVHGASTIEEFGFFLKSIDTSCSVSYARMPFKGPSAAALNAAFTSSGVVFLFSTAALNGGDQTIKAEVWDGDLDTSRIKVGNLYYIHGEWNNKPYTNKEGEEVSPRQLSMKKVWDLGESIMSVGTPPKTAVKKRPVLVDDLDDLDDDLSF